MTAPHELVTFHAMRNKTLNLRGCHAWRIQASSLIVICLALVAVGLQAADHRDWPAITREQRPWAYWWWMGSAVDKTNLTRELTRYSAAGYGGVHIIPIYGAKGWETNYTSYLSPQWMELLDHTVREANRLGLGVDMTTGTGWCFGGGPYVGENEGNATVVVKSFELAAGAKLAEKFDAAKIHALVAFPGLKSAPGESGDQISDARPATRNRPVVRATSAAAQEAPPAPAIDLIGRIQADGAVNWTAPAGGAKVYAVSQQLAAQKVKRAAPGGEGPMLNLIYPDAMPFFLRSHTEAFAKYRGAKPRAQYHDSYEYKSEWGPDFFHQFKKRRGYSLQNELPALFSETGDRTARVLTDYRETVSDIMVEDSLPQWVKWSHQRGFITRNEAHGSPGNLLDLYAITDVPETEMFRLDRNKFVSKYASSAAHVAGRKFVGCETGTWLKEHFTETLADMKYLVDDLFVSGVNHVFYHGTCYSPDEAGWPGWVFYASYQMNPRNSIWRDARALNDYIARCQAVLQAGQPDNDVLVYWPIHDFWQKAPAEPILPHLTVHARGWFEGQPISKISEELWYRGYTFDYISDRQLAQAKVSGGGIKVPGGNYQTVVVPPCDFMPLGTLEKLVALAKSGATVIFAGELPKDVPGLGDLENRRAKFQNLLAMLGGATGSAAIGKGRVWVGQLESALAQNGVVREAMADHKGLYHIRRAISGGRYYFLANRSEQPIDGWMPLATVAKSVVLMDPMTGRTGNGAIRQNGKTVEVYLQLQPGESIVVRTSNRSAGRRPAWASWRDTKWMETITGSWQVDFVSGGPTLPPSFTTTSLGSWTQSSPAAEHFAGTARYTVTFDAKAPGTPQWLDLGAVSQSARVKLNGKDYGTLIIAPFRVVVDNLKATGNTLEVEVTSVAANRIRDLDRRGVKWQNFHDINFVNQDYRPFDASNWPVTDCGLLGPLTLKVVQPVSVAGGEK
jgi:hypothetical protein